MTRVLRVASLTLQYGGQPTPALQEVSLELGPGESIWLAGATGAGCSSLLLAAAGLAPRLTGGSRTGLVEVLGRDPGDDLGALAGRVALLTANPATQLSGIAATVAEEVAFGPANLGWPRDRILSATERALARTGLAALAPRAPATLSGGELQRLVVAAALVFEPALWLLDEPTSALDTSATAVVHALLKEELARGAAILLATEDAEAARRLTQRTVVLQEGRVAAEGPTSLLLASDALFDAGAAGHPLAQLALAARVLGGGPRTGAPYPLDREAAEARWLAG